MVVRRRLAGTTDGMVYAVEEYPLWRDQQGRSRPQGQGQGTHHEDKSDAVSAAHEAERGCGLGRGGRVEVGAGVGRRGGGGGGRRGGGECIDETVEEEGGPVSEMGEEGHGGRWCMYVLQCSEKNNEAETGCKPPSPPSPPRPGHRRAESGGRLGRRWPCQVVACGVFTTYFMGGGKRTTTDFLTHSMEHPPLPLDVLSNVAALIPPPYYPWPQPTAQTTATTPAPDVIRNLDPAPTPLQTDLQAISAITRASSRLLEAARPWLWEDVDVKTGRGWLAIVNALTEEVIEQDVDSLTPIAGSAPASDGTGSGRATPVPPPEPSRQPGTIPQATQAYTSPSSAPLPFPIVSGSGHVAPGSSAYPQMSTSPPQPTHIHQLLTPPTSRNTSPRARTSPALPPILTNPQPRAEQSPSPGPPGPPGPSASPGPSSVVSPSAVARTKLRGRSRSPRRSVGFDTEGIQAVLERSRSVSSPRSGGPNGSVRGAFMHRRTSLSRSRTWHDGPRDEEEDEDEDEVMPLTAPPARYKAGVITPRLLPAEREIANADLLPPPGPYIRHLNFTNFRTIGSRRSQEEAVRGRFVTAGRLEGVIKVSPPNHRSS